MNQTDVESLLKFLHAAFPRWSTEAGDSQARAFLAGLEDLEVEDVSKAVNQYLQSESRPPTIAAIRRLAEEARRVRQAEEEMLAEPCQWCVDGWVELAGTVKIHGVTYSRGTTPCKWCEQGKRRYRALAATGHAPESDYEPSDVVMPRHDDTIFRPDADFLREMERDFDTPREVLWNLFPRRIWPAEWPAPAAPVEVVEPVEAEQASARVGTLPKRRR